MALADLFDSIVQVWRPAPALDQARAKGRVYTLVGSAACCVNRPRAPLGDPGPGLTPRGVRRFYALPGVDVQLRDVLVLSGPDAGRWEVDEPPSRPRGHHVEINCIAWTGRLPIDEEGS